MGIFAHSITLKIQIEIISEALSFFVLLLRLWTKAITVAWKTVSCRWHFVLNFARIGTVLLYVVQAPSMGTGDLLGP
jgi:hypothetical protein